jgi:integration host factor subunit alpha
MKLTKAKLIDAICDANGYSSTRSSELVETVLEIIKGTLERGEDVLVSGFGKWQVKHKRERRGRNPATGDEMMLAPRRVVTFKCSSKLRDRLNK